MLYAGIWVDCNDVRLYITPRGCGDFSTISKLAARREHSKSAHGALSGDGGRLQAKRKHIAAEGVSLMIIHQRTSLAASTSVRRFSNGEACVPVRIHKEEADLTQRSGR